MLKLEINVMLKFINVHKFIKLIKFKMLELKMLTAKICYLNAKIYR